MNCPEIHHLLYDYVRGDLENEEEKIIARHLKGCPECRAELKQVRLYIKAMTGIQKITPPADFLQSVTGGIENQGIWNRIKRSLFYPIPIKIPLETAGVLAIALIIFVIYQPADMLKKEPYELTYSHDDISVSEKEKDTGIKADIHEKKSPTVMKTLSSRKASEKIVTKKAPVLPLDEMDSFSVSERMKDAPMVGGAPKSLKEELEISDRESMKSEGYAKTNEDTAVLNLALARDNAGDDKSRVRAAKKSAPRQESIIPRSQVQRIKSMTKKYSGRILNETRDYKTEYIKLEIPVKNYRPFLNELHTIGAIQEKKNPPVDLKRHKKVQFNIDVIH